jgi:nitrite reductase/ring-hydroxylating ferredoxin subunit/uncharacterized membrane protein
MPTTTRPQNQASTKLLTIRSRPATHLPGSTMAIYELTERLERLEGLDDFAGTVADLVGKLVPPGAVKNALSGTWLGHTLHPVLTDLPIGTWTSAALLDLVGGEDSAKAAELLVGLGILSSLPTAASGFSDWADTQEGERRVGLVHALSNTAALALLSGSYAARRRGNRRRGVVLGLMGTGVATFGAYLGGHLTMGLGVGTNQAALEDGLPDWTAVTDAATLEGGQPVKAVYEGTQLVLVKLGSRFYGLSSRCTHLGGPLEDGELHGKTITCPWHGSTFDLEDGAVVEGPARCPQPAYEVREREGKIEVRLREPARA